MFATRGIEIHVHRSRILVRRGVNVGEFAIYNLTLFNMLNYFFLQRTEYRNSANSEHRKIVYTTVRELSVSYGCGRDELKDFPIVNIKVPAMIPRTDSDTCKLIKIGYILSVIDISFVNAFIVRSI